MGVEDLLFPSLPMDCVHDQTGRHHFATGLVRRDLVVIGMDVLCLPQSEDWLKKFQPTSLWVVLYIFWNWFHTFQLVLCELYMGRFQISKRFDYIFTPTLEEDFQLDTQFFDRVATTNYFVTTTMLLLCSPFSIGIDVNFETWLSSLANCCFCDEGLWDDESEGVVDAEMPPWPRHSFVRVACMANIKASNRTTAFPTHLT